MAMAGSSVCFGESLHSTERLEEEIRAIMQEESIPGMIASIVEDGQVIWQGAFGVAEISSGRRVTHQTHFRMGSITKTMVGLAALRLAESGHLSLDDPVAERIPEVGLKNPWAKHSPVLFQHLLEHTAGLDDSRIRDYAVNAPDFTVFDGIDYNIGSKRARWPPGTAMSYSNVGTAIAAYYMEKVTGQSFEEIVQRQVFDELGMISATFRPASSLAKSYQIDGLTEIPFVHIGLKPAGAMLATNEDMSVVLRMLLDRGKVGSEQYLDSSSVVRMETPGSTLGANHGLRVGRGIGNQVVLHDGFVYQGHRGIIHGYISEFRYLAKFGRGYFLSINSNNMPGFQRIQSEIRAYVTRDLNPTPAKISKSIQPSELSILSGFYEPVTPRNEFFRGLEVLLGTLSVRQSKQQLRVRGLTGAPRFWSPVDPLSFVTSSGDALPSVMFVRSNRDLFIQGEFGAFQRISSAKAIGRWMAIFTAILVMAITCIHAVVRAMLLIRPSVARKISLRLWLLPSVASISFFAAVAMHWYGFADPQRMAAPTFWSIGYWFASWLFVGASACSLGWFLFVRKELRLLGHKHLRLYLASALAAVFVAAYTLNYEMIGVRFWVY